MEVPTLVVSCHHVTNPQVPNQEAKIDFGLHKCDTCPLGSKVEADEEKKAVREMNAK